MDAELKLLADTGLQVTEAEESLAAGDPGPARTALDRADESLAELRRRWPALSGAQRGVVGAAAGPVRARLDAARARLPRRIALSDGAPERDPEEDADPVATVQRE
jgi:hypothetical protein